MTIDSHSDREQNDNLKAPKLELDPTTPACKDSQDPILCPHCLRTASNGLKCKGICVADSDY